MAYYQTATWQHPCPQGNSNEDAIITYKQVFWVLPCFTGSECSSILTYSILNSPPGANPSVLCRRRTIFTYSSGILSQVTMTESTALSNLGIGSEWKKNTLTNIHIQ